MPVLAEAAELEGVDEVFPVCARSGEGLDELVERLGELVPEGPYMYPTAGAQRSVERAAAGRADPRAGPEPDPRGGPALGRGLGRRGLGAPDDGLVTVKAEIWVETESQKGILIGREGSKVGEIGTAARR